MSQQGPGGYGGWGPSGPAGAPPGYAQQPPGQPYGMPQGAAPPGAPEPPKKTNPLVWVGVGCAVLLMFGVGLAVVAFIWVRTSRGVSASGAFSAGVEVALDGGALSFDAGATTGVPPGALGRGGPTCEKAADCCRRVVEKTGATAGALESCESLRTNVAEVGCQQALQTYRASAPLFGVACP